MFQCSDPDLHEFFHLDSRDGSRQLTSVTYTVFDAGNPAAFFSLSNDAIHREETAPSGWRRLVKKIHHGKRYASQPAVKIGRLAVASGLEGRGLGSQILDFLKWWFVTGNKTGCRFIIVDAYRKPDVLKFYLKNGFQALEEETEISPSDTTILMYFDLLPVSRAIAVEEQGAKP